MNTKNKNTRKRRRISTTTTNAGNGGSSGGGSDGGGQQQKQPKQQKQKQQQRYASSSCTGAAAAAPAVRILKKYNPRTSAIAFEERITTSTITSEVRLRHEAVRYTTRYLEQLTHATFTHVGALPVCARIVHTLDWLTPTTPTNTDTDTNTTSSDDSKNDQDRDQDQDQDNNDWNYCQALFGLAAATTTTASTATTSTATQPILQIRYPFEVLPVFIISSSLVANCRNDRNALCYSMWKQFNNMNNSSGTAQDSNDTTNASHDTNSNNTTNTNTKTICLYLPHLLSTWNETLNVLWDGLLHHYENTTIAPSRKRRTATATTEGGGGVETEATPYTEEEAIMNSGNDNDNDDDDMEAIMQRCMEDPNDPESQRYMYHISKRKYYEHMVSDDTAQSKSKIFGTKQTITGKTKKQQSLQDFILEFLLYVYDDDEQQYATKPTGSGDDGGAPRNLIVLIEDPRIRHEETIITAATAAAASSSSGIGLGGAGSGMTNNWIVQQQLLRTLIVWRTQYGIPISLVVMNSQNSSTTNNNVSSSSASNKNLLLNPSYFNSSFCSGTIRTIRYTVPLPKTTTVRPTTTRTLAASPRSTLSPADTDTIASTTTTTNASTNINMGIPVWCQYFFNEIKQTPLPLLVSPQIQLRLRQQQQQESSAATVSASASASVTATDVFLRLCTDTIEHDSSCTTFIDKLRTKIITEFLIYKGSFVWDALSIADSPARYEYTKYGDSNNNVDKRRGDSCHDGPNDMLTHDHDGRDSNNNCKKEGKTTTNYNGKNNVTDHSKLATTPSSSSLSSSSITKSMYTIGNDDVNIFSPQFVAWMCSYHNAQKLLSPSLPSTTSKSENRMSLSDKCDALLYCYGLMKEPNNKNDSSNNCSNHKKKFINSNNNGRKNKSNNNYYCRNDNTDININNINNDTGRLRFWWTISCSLLPLHILSLSTVSLSLSSFTTTTTKMTAIANRARMATIANELLGQYNWILQQLADVYHEMTTTMSEKEDDDDKPVVDEVEKKQEEQGEAVSSSLTTMTTSLLPTTSTTIGTSTNTAIATPAVIAASNNEEEIDDNEMNETSNGNSWFASAISRIIGRATAEEVSTAKSESEHEEQEGKTEGEAEVKIDEKKQNNKDKRAGNDDEYDYVEWTLRRYLQRSNSKQNNDDDHHNDVGTPRRSTRISTTKPNTAHNDGRGDKDYSNVDERKRWELITMVREMVILIDALNKMTTTIVTNSSKNKNGDDDDEEDAAIIGYNKIRKGVSETILKMNRIALGQVEEWTSRWIEINPLMPIAAAAVSTTAKTKTKDEIFHTSIINNNGDGRPMNIRRRILDNLPTGSRQLYEILVDHGRQSSTIDRDEWFRTYGGTVEDFAVGVWTLRQCGLVRPKKTKMTQDAVGSGTGKGKQQQQRRRRQLEVIVYEKVAVVWC